LIAHGCTSASEPHLLATVHATDGAELLVYIEHRATLGVLIQAARYGHTRDRPTAFTDDQTAAITDPIVVVAGGAQRLPQKYRGPAGRQ
jgi:hypothetical protein